MNSLTSIILGVLQGITEFLPISSSGHLVLLQNLFGYSEPELLMDSSLHLGTLFAVIIYFREDLKKIINNSWLFLCDLSKRKRGFCSGNDDPHVSLALMVVVGTVPTGLIGYFFKDGLESLFGSVEIVGIMLILNGLILLSTRLISEGHSQRKRVSWFTALAVGIVQGLAIIPGISRSGSTIACGIFCGTDRDTAARFSFLLSIPAIIGAVCLQLSPSELLRVGLLPLLLGFVCAAVVGLVALKWLMVIVRRGNLFYFAPYCWIVGLLILFIKI